MGFLPMSARALKNLFSKPATRPYPAVRRQPFAASRGALEIDFTACVFCGACVRRCPAKALAVDRSAKSWELDVFSCVTCGACVRACPKRCLSLAPTRPQAKRNEGGRGTIVRMVRAPEPLAVSAGGPAEPAAPEKGSPDA